MKEKLDFTSVGALLKKQRIESLYPYRRGNFDIAGFILRFVLLGAIIALFVVFFGKFIDIYLSIKYNNALNVGVRTIELLTMIYTCVIIFMVLGGVGQINRQIFAADDIKMFSAMPVTSRALYISKLISIYIGQLIVSTVVVLTVNITFATHAAQGASFWVVTALTCILLPLVAITIASVVALPFNVIKRFLSDKFIVIFIIITVITGLAFWLYSIVLGAVQQMLVGEDLRYFFNEKVMNVIASLCSFLYPARWLANLLAGKSILVSAIGIIALTLLCLVASLLIIRIILSRALQSRIAGATNFIKKKGKLQNGDNGFFALVKKDFLLIFRTPAYTFSYFSVAIVMPLMVYFCMSVGSSLVDRLLGMEFNLELAVLLTLLFGALTNIFCATNISRDGQMFYIVKAFPIDYKTVFFSKIVLCLMVTALSQLASAILLLATGYVQWYAAIFLFVVGMLFSFVNICVATRYDFNHAHFSTEEDGEIKESSGVVSTIILLGIIISFAVGGIVFVSKILTTVKEMGLSWLTYLIAGGAALICAAIAFLYFILNLEKKYYQFQGGNI